jgi:hypothetical protein
MKKTLLILSICTISLLGCKKPAEPSIPGVPVMPQVPAESKTQVFNVTLSTVLNSEYWNKIQLALASRPVDVIFEDGTYTLNKTIELKNIGHNRNRLTLKTASVKELAVFDGTIAKLMTLTNCKNIGISNFKFTGDVTDYALTVSHSQNIEVSNSHFVDMPKIYYGAFGAHHNTSDNIIVKNNTFARVGIGSTAHMIYGAYGVKRLKVVQNTFTDCAGSFVRFRGNLSTEGVVYGNSFKSTGTYRSTNSIFVEVPVFNDVNPGDERFGTKFMIAKNTFDYATVGNQTTRFALVFHHSGYSPKDRTHLISVADAATLKTGTLDQKRALMLSRLGLKGEEILFGNNVNVHVQTDVSFRVQGGYDAVAPFTGIIDISSTVNNVGLATTTTQALAYYDNLH